jgi:hypothetical protein
LVTKVESGMGYSLTTGLIMQCSSLMRREEQMSL